MDLRRALVWTLAIMAAATAFEVGAVQLKIATLAPDGSHWMKAVRKGTDEIEERTEGRVKFRIYPGGSMGNEAAVLRKIRIGQLHGGVFTSGTLITAYPDIDVYALPMLMRSYDEVDHVRSRVDERLMADLAKNGYVAFGIIEGGFAYLMSNKATRGFEDLKGQKAWTPEGDEVGTAILNAAGISAIPLPVSDVLTGLQTGLIDTVAAPMVGAVALQWFTKVKYVTEVPIVYTYGSIALSNKAFARIAEADQIVVREVLERVTKGLDRGTRKDNEGAREALVKQGLQFLEMTPEGTERWSEVAAKARGRLVEEGYVSSGLVAEIEQMLKEYRAQQE